MKTHTNSDVIVRISFSRLPYLSEWDSDHLLWSTHTTVAYIKLNAEKFIEKLKTKISLHCKLIPVAASPNAHSDQTLLGDINSMFSHVPILSDEFDDTTRTQQRIFFSESFQSP